MDSKLLSENDWKAIVQKYKVKDNGLQRALANFEKLDEKEHDDCLKAIGLICQLATNLKRVKEVVDNEDLVENLDDLTSAADDEKREILKAKALAEKTAKAAAATATREQAESDKEEKEEDNYVARLTSALQKLKGSRGVSYEFIVCDARPHCAVTVAKQITSSHKAELTKVTDGSKRFLHTGTCSFEDGKFNFVMERPASGLARKLQDSIKNFTGKKFPIVVGPETAEEDEDRS
jgi:Rad3-related DNA helicase